MKYKKMNKKGIGPLVIPIILGAFLMVGLALGWFASFNINSIFTSPIIIIFIVLLFLWMLSGGKKRWKKNQ